MVLEHLAWLWLVSGFNPHFFLNMLSHCLLPHSHPCPLSLSLPELDLMVLRYYCSSLNRGVSLALGTIYPARRGSHFYFTLWWRSWSGCSLSHKATRKDTRLSRIFKIHASLGKCLGEGAGDKCGVEHVASLEQKQILPGPPRGHPRHKAEVRLCPQGPDPSPTEEVLPPLLITFPFLLLPFSACSSGLCIPQGLGTNKIHTWTPLSGHRIG